MAKSYNPFSMFRKNQKVALAFITLLSMFAFVCVGPSLMGRGNNGGGPGKAPVLAKWNYGDILQSDVKTKVMWRARINRFLQKTYDVAAKEGKVDPEGHAMRFMPETEAGVLQSMVLEKKAELLGMTVSDKSINDYIDSVTKGTLTQEQKDQALTDVCGDTRYSSGQLSDELFESMRFELLARDFDLLLSSDAIDYNTPEERWDFYSRLNRQATVQALPVAVKDFVGKVPNPDNAELEKLFDQSKNQLARPEFPEPGFMVPSHAKFQYFKAVRTTLSKADESKITDQEINDYYDKHKEEFRKSTLDDSAFPSSGEKPKAGTNTSAEKPNAAATPKVATPSAAAPKAAAPSAAAPKAAAPTTPQPAGKPKADANPQPKPASGKSSDTRPARNRSDDELLALADDAALPSAAPPSTKTTGGSSPAAASPPAAKTPPPTAAPAATAPTAPVPTKTPAKTAPAKSPPAPAGPAKTEPGKAVPAAPAKAASESPAAEFDSITDPKVRASIRTTLANQKSAAEINDAFGKLRTEVQIYSRQRAVWVGDNSPPDQEPKAPDFKALAKGYGYTFEETGSVTSQEVQDKELGASMQLNEASNSVIRFPQLAFDPNLASYMPSESMAPDGEVSYLWWRIEFEASYVPNFSDAKAEVTRAWKMIEARKLAMIEAKKYSDDANKRRASLKEMFQNRPNMTVAEIGPFHWLTLGNLPMDNSTQRSISLTRLSGVDLAGDEFMHAVFRTDVGSTAVAFNQPQTIAYVVQLEKLDPPEDTFRQQFQNYQVQSANAQNWGQAGQAASDFAQLVERAKLQAIEKDLGFQMLAAPTPGKGSNAPAGPADDDQGD